MVVRAKSIWAVQSFLSCFVVNALLMASFYFMAKQVLEGMNQWVDPFLQSGAQALPADARNSFASLKQFLSETRQYLEMVIFGLGGLGTLILWLIVHLQGRGLARRLERPAPSPLSAHTASAKEEKGGAFIAEEPPQAAVIPSAPSPQPAVQILSILQRQGRFIDFLQEDLTLYDDSQIGAAVRSIHQGCREALQDHIQLKPIFSDAEGDEVSVAPGFDPRSIRLTGNVTGDPPFTGILRHRGWRVERLELPQATAEQKYDWVIAPAEVEIEG